MFSKTKTLFEFHKKLGLKDEWKSKEDNWEDNFWLVEIPEKRRWKGNAKEDQAFGYFTSWAARDLILGCELIKSSAIVRYAIPKEESAAVLEGIVQECQKNEGWFGHHCNTVPVIRYIGHSYSLQVLIGHLRSKARTTPAEPELEIEFPLEQFKIGQEHVNNQVVDGSNFWILESEKVKKYFEEHEEEYYSGRGYTDDESHAKLFIEHGATVENYNIDKEPSTAQAVMTFVAKANDKPKLYGVWREDDRISDHFYQYLQYESDETEGETLASVIDKLDNSVTP